MTINVQNGCARQHAFKHEVEWCMSHDFAYFWFTVSSRWLPLTSDSTRAATASARASKSSAFFAIGGAEKEGIDELIESPLAPPTMNITSTIEANLQDRMLSQLLWSQM